MTPLHPDDYRDIVRRALAEDVGGGDVTTLATVDETARARGVFLVKGECVLAGTDVAAETFRQVDSSVVVAFHRHDGTRCHAGDEAGEVLGPARALLVAERTALNFLQRLSGIASRTREFVEAAAGRIVVLDTRKTTPTLRALEKYAVRAGGGTNHRIGLFDAVLIKENHAAMAGGVGEAVRKARAGAPAGTLVEVECRDDAEVEEALAAGAERILLDNMSPAQMRAIVDRVDGRAELEASGGIDLETIRDVAETGVDFVSVGALTHSAPSLDLSLLLEPAP